MVVTISDISMSYTRPGLLEIPYYSLITLHSYPDLPCILGEGKIPGISGETDNGKWGYNCNKITHKGEKKSESGETRVVFYKAHYNSIWQAFSRGRSQWLPD